MWGIGVESSTMIIGGLVGATGYFLTFFATNFTHLFFTFGLMVGMYSTNHVYLHRPNAFGFGNRVYTCVTKHSNAFRTFLNWLKNSKRVWHEPKLHILRLLFSQNFDL